MANQNDDEIEDDEVDDYLDDLRESGVTNMFGAGPYLQREFGFDRPTATQRLLRWMQNFGKRNGKDGSDE